MLAKAQHDSTEAKRRKLESAPIEFKQGWGGVDCKGKIEEFGGNRDQALR